MKTQLMKNGRKWSLYGGLFAAIAYAGLTLNSAPAYALDSCTAQECGTLCYFYCNERGGGFEGDYCNVPVAGKVTCVCKNGTLVFICS
jgi:hypothetical protein